MGQIMTSTPQGDCEDLINYCQYVFRTTPGTPGNVSEEDCNWETGRKRGWLLLESGWSDRTSLSQDL